MSIEVKYFETTIKHPVTSENVTVYCKGLFSEDEITVHYVHTEELPFVLMKKTTAKKLGEIEEIQRNFYVQMCDYVLNLSK